jgi:hypothetical protein
MEEIRFYITPQAAGIFLIPPIDHIHALATVSIVSSAERT